MTDKTSTTNEAITAFNEAAQAAHETISGPYAAAVEATRQEFSDIVQRQSKQAHKAALVAMLVKSSETAIRNKGDKEKASTTLKEYAAGLAKYNESGLMTPAQVVLTHLAGDLRKYSERNRIGLVNAVVGAAQGDVDSGLIEFPESWSSEVDPQHLELLAMTVSPQGVDALNKMEAGLEPRRLELLEAREALAQAKPVIARTVEQTAPSVVIVKNSRGPLTLAGVALEGQTTNELTLTQWAALSSDKNYRWYADQGLVEVVSRPALIEVLA